MDPLTIGMLVILAVLIFFMFRNSRKRKQQQEELQAQIVPGVEIMTNFGLFGTLKSIDEVANSAEIEVSPGTVLKVHRQTIARVVNNDEVEPGTPRSVEEAMEIANREAEERERAAQGEDAATPLGEPEFGERVQPESKKPGRGSSNKTSE
jgi:preprotein translocase subunit YajC